MASPSSQPTVQTSMPPKSREDWIDYVRSIALLSIITIHCSDLYAFKFHSNYWIVEAFFKIIAECGVPLFIMISGYLLIKKSDSLIIFYRKRISCILLPFIFFSFIYYTINIYPSLSDTVKLIFFKYDSSYIYTIISNYIKSDLSIKNFINVFIHKPTCYHLWFMYLLIGYYFCIPFLKKMVDNLDDAEQLLFL